MGRHKRFTVKQLEEKWEEYKKQCDNKSTEKTEFSQKEGMFCTGYKRTYVTYTIEGFCVFIKLSRQAFYSYYRDDPRYVDMVTRMREECEVDAREKFETERIPTKLAGLWMSKYDDYKQKQEIELPKDNNIEVIIKSDVEDVVEEALAD